MAGLRVGGHTAPVIEKIDYERTEGIQTEIDALRGIVEPVSEISVEAATLEDYVRPFEATLFGKELALRVRACAAAARRPLKVLDIGPGGGMSSLWLAAQGHRVFCVEPSPEHCAHIEFFAQHFAQEITIYECSAEGMHAIPEGEFDLCVFNVSFHHCDDPARALGNCHALLGSGGQVILTNEPILRFYQGKAGFHERLEADPIASGHYGGNEHSYYYWDYVSMLEGAGFRITDFLHSRYSTLRRSFEDYVMARISGQPVHSLEALFPRLAWFLVLKGVQRSRLTMRLFKRLSLLQVSFVGTKS